MSGPGVVCIKRKRSLPAPEHLIVEPPGKRSRNHVHYVLQRDDEQESAKSNIKDGKRENERAAGNANGHGSHPTEVVVPTDRNTPPGPVVHAERRVFHLKRPNSLHGSVRKRKQAEHGIATFVERRVKSRTSALADGQTSGDETSRPRSTVERFKRPSKRAAVLGNAVPVLPAPGQDLEGIAESLHRFALEESAKDTHKVLRTPKLSGQRSREIHQQRVASAAAVARQQDQDVDMDRDEDNDYVYDTYVLAPTISAGAAQVEAQGSSGSVGYLIITEEDQKIWEEYIEDEPSDKDWDSDENDENAEDWYGADYPDDELSMDDEFDENPYKYHGDDLSDDGGWNADEQSWSDDEYERQTQPWNTKTAKRYRKYLEGDKDGSNEHVDEHVDDVDGRSCQ